MVSGISGGPSASQMQQMQKMMRERMQAGGGGQGGMPEMPSGMQSILKDAMSQGGSMDDVKSRVQSGFAEYQKTDEYKALSDDQKTKLTDLVQNGPPQPPAGFDPSAFLSSGGEGNASASSGQASQVDLIKSLLNQLEDKGSSTRAKLDAQASRL